MSVTKYSKEGLMIHTEGEIRKSKDEELTLVQPDNRGQGFSFNRVVAGLSR